MEVKAKSNLAKQGVTFARAATVLLDPMAITVIENAHSQLEERSGSMGSDSIDIWLIVPFSRSREGVKWKIQAD